MRYRWLIVLCLAVLSACGADNAPVERVKEFVAATEARDVDRMVAMIAPEDRRDAGWQLRQVMPRVEEIKLTEPQYVLDDGGDNDDNTARVRVSGLMVGKTSEGEPINAPSSQLIELVKVDGVWYITGNGLEPPPTP